MFRKVTIAFLCVILIFIAGAVGFVFSASQTPAKAPVDEQHNPIDTIEVFFQGLNQQNYEKSYECLLDCSSLGFEKTPKSEIAAFLWEKIRSSYSYEILGEPQVEADMAYVDVKITRLSLEKAVSYVKSRTTVLIEYEMEHPEDVGEIFDENGEYRESFIMAQYERATKDILEDPEKFFTQVDVKLTLQYVNGKWWIVVTDDLALALLGDTFV